MIPSSSNYFFLILLSAAIVLAFLIFLPFLSPLVLAAALAVIFAPLHRLVLRVFFRSREKNSFGALITLLLIAVIVFVPIAFISMKMYSEVQSMYSYLVDEQGRAQVVTALNTAADSASKLLFGLYPEHSFDSFNIVVVFQSIVQWTFANINTIFAQVSKVALGFFVMCLALFYFLRDGRELKRQLISLSPLGDVDDEHIFHKLQQAIRSIFAGSIAVGIIQGILTGIGFVLFQVPNPVLWGAVASLAALIPGVGTSLVLIPAILYLFFTGPIGPAIGLLLWSILAVGLIDNFLGPIFVNRGIKIHPFMILLSVLGGLTFFGPIGFVLGPLVLAFLFSLLEIYRSSREKA